MNNGTQCDQCGHLIEEHDVVGEAADGREMLACSRKDCRCEILEGEA